MKRRLFIAIKPGPDIMAVCRTWRNNHSNLPVRFLEPENLHMTVIPPWYGDPVFIDTLLRTKSTGIKYFYIYFDRIEGGPDVRHPELIWVKGPPSPPLEKLQRELSSSLEVPVPTRPLVSHITLARQEKSKIKFDTQNIRWTMRVFSFNLIESQLTPQGARYTTLGTYHLRHSEIISS